MMLVLAVVLCLAFHFALSLILPLQTSRVTRFLNSQRWIRVNKTNPLGRHWTAIASIRHTRRMVIEGYERFSKHATPFVLAQFTQSPLLVLSAKHLEELLLQPETKVNFAAANLDIPPVQHTLGSEFSSGPHIDLVKSQFTRKLPTIVDGFHNEVLLAMQEHWPASAEDWVAVKVKPTSMAIVRRATNRILCGKALCRNPKFLHSVSMYFDVLLQTAGLLTLCPAALYWIVVPILQHRLRYWQKLCAKHTSPEIRQRLEALRSDNRYSVGGDKPNGPDDALQWLLHDEYTRRTATKVPVELDLDLITLRILVWNILSIHTIGMTVTNVLLDLCHSDRKEEYIASLHEECTRVLGQNDGIWTTEALHGLIRVDSAIRESMRVSPLADVAVKRTITEPSGITISNGLHIPPGTIIAAPTYGIHHDPDIYPDHPGVFDALRFSRPFEKPQQYEESTVEDLKPRLAITTTKIGFLPFGYARHACPGRHLAAMEMKLLLAHIILNYDIEARGPRLPNVRTAQSSVPGDAAEIWIRRKGV